MPTYTTALNANVDLELRVNVDTQSVSNNATRFDLRLRMVNNSGSTYWTGTSCPWEIRSPSGTKIKSGSKSYTLNGHSSFVLYDGSVTLEHKADGTFSQKFYGKFTPADGYLSTGTASGTPSVPTIPRATTPTWSGSFVAGDAKTITLPRASSGFTHVVTYKFGNATGTISSSAGASVSFTPPMSLLNQIPKAINGTGTITVVTKNGSSTIGTESKSFTLSAGSEVVPNVTNVTVADTKATVAANIGALVQGVSIATIAIGGNGVYGSTINSARARWANGSLTAAGIPMLVETSGSIPFTAEVIDSRGRIGTSARTLNVLAYTPPTLDTGVLDIWRVDANGVPDTTGTRLKAHIKAAVSSLIVSSVEKNSMTLKLWTRVAGSGSAWTLRNTLTPGLSHNAAFNVGGGDNYDLDKGYEVRISVADRTGYGQSGDYPGVVFDTLVQSSLVTLSMHDNSVGVGKLWERGTLDVGGDTYISGDLDVTGGIIKAGESVLVEPDLPFRIFATTALMNAWSAPNGSKAYVTANNREYVRQYGNWYGVSPLGGTVTLTPPSGGGQVTQNLTFPTGYFRGAPLVMATPQTGAGVTVTMNVSVASITQTSAVLNLNRSNGTATVISWVAFPAS